METVVVIGKKLRKLVEMNPPMISKPNGYNMSRLKILVCGADGYIGFPLVVRCLHKGHIVHGIDNLSRRFAVESLGSISATKISKPRDRVSDLSIIGDYTSHSFDILHDRVNIEKLIQRYKFDVIINLAHNPSAPYSMIDRSHAEHVLTNNILMTNNILWYIKQYSPDTHYLTIGSTGEYNHTIGVDIEEGYFNFEHNGKISKECLFPRQGNSIYHCSKIASTYLIDYLSRIWNLRCTDVMQSIVYGLYTDDMERYKQTNRCDTDECFGTVVNRFVVQAMLGVPLTVFGHGMHQRAFLSLNDSIQALEIAINNPPPPGKVQSWNQLSECVGIKHISDIIKSIINNTTIENVDNPRKEFTGGHYYHFKTDKLKNLGYEPTRTMIQEIEYMMTKIKIDDSNKNILMSVVKPRVIF
jgi:UDP-sulfoquinovose synthase